MSYVKNPLLINKNVDKNKKKTNPHFTRYSCFFENVGIVLTWWQPHGGWSHQVTSVNESRRGERHARPHGGQHCHTGNGARHRNGNSHRHRGTRWPRLEPLHQHRPVDLILLLLVRRRLLRCLNHIRQLKPKPQLKKIGSLLPLTFS